jgi:hypothetical protein
MQRFQKVLFLGAAILGLVVLWSVTISVELRYIFPLINSDSLFFQVLYQDLLIDGNTLYGWDLNTVFNLFPNSILYLAAFILNQNPFVSNIIHGLLQYALFYGSVYWLFKVLRHSTPIHWHVAGLIFINLLFVDAVIRNDPYITSLFIHPYHFGSFILFFLLTAANLSYKKKPHKNTAMLIATMLVLGVFSNKILIIMFVIPWFSALLIAWWQQRISKRFLIMSTWLNLGGAAGGILLWIILKNLLIFTFARTKMFSWENIGPSFKALFNTYTQVLTQTTPMTIIVIFAFVFFIFNLGWCMVHFFRPQKPESLSEDDKNFHLWMWVNLAFTFLVFFAPAVNGMFFGLASVRYNFFVLILPLLNTGLLSHYFLHDKIRFKKPVSIYLSAFFLLAGILTTTVFISQTPIKERYNEKKNYYPEISQVLDKLAEQTPLKDGISLYLSAKTGTLFSRKGIKIRQVYNDLKLYPLAVARSWYYPQKEGDKLPVFNFIVYDEQIPMQKVHDIFGEENIEIITKDSYTIILVPEFTFQRNRSIILLSDLKSNNKE